MSVSQPSLTVQRVAAAKSRGWIEPLLGLATGVLGGAIQSKILSTPMSHSILLGGFFGLAFSLFFDGQKENQYVVLNLYPFTLTITGHRSSRLPIPPRQLVALTVKQFPFGPNPFGPANCFA